MTMRSRATERVRGACALSGLLAALLLLAACGSGSGEAVSQAAPAESADTAAAEGVEAVYAELEGLSGSARQERLLELAEAEGGVLSLYCVLNGEEAEAVPAAFEEATGISVERYRASSQDTTTRIIEEAAADATAADAFCVNGPEGVVLDREGLLAPLQIDVEGYPSERVEGTFAWFFISAFAPWWNTTLVSESDVPQTWEDVLAYDGRLALEVKAFDWFATLVEDYFMAEQGLTKEEAVDLFRQAADGAVLVDGHSVGGQLLSSGEFDMMVGYSWVAEAMAQEGAPVAWRPPVEPLVSRPNVVGVLKEAAHPATALLYVEFMLGAGQEILVEYGRTPANPTAGGGRSDDIELLPIDLEKMVDERAEWESLYAEVLQQSGSEVRGG